MDKLKALEKYINYDFSTGIYEGKDYITFQNKYISYLKCLAKNNNWEIAKINKNHYEFSCFIKNSIGKYIYLSISDVRYFKDNWYQSILIRTAISDKDYTGGSNNYTSLPYLANKITNMFLRP